MDWAAFVTTTLAGALLKQLATDAYKAVKDRLSSAFGLGAVVGTLEKEPADAVTREFVAKKLAASGALEDQAVRDGTARIADELTRLPPDTPLGASLTVRDLEAASVVFRNNCVRPGGAMSVEAIKATGTILFEGNEVGDDRKR